MQRKAGEKRKEMVHNFKRETWGLDRCDSSGYHSWSGVAFEVFYQRRSWTSTSGIASEAPSPTNHRYPSRKMLHPNPFPWPSLRGLFWASLVDGLGLKLPSPMVTRLFRPESGGLSGPLRKKLWRSARSKGWVNKYDKEPTYFSWRYLPQDIVVTAFGQEVMSSAIYLLFPSAPKKLRFLIHIFNLERCTLSLDNLQLLRHGSAMD